MTDGGVFRGLMMIGDMSRAQVLYMYYSLTGIGGDNIGDKIYASLIDFGGTVFIRVVDILRQG